MSLRSAATQLRTLVGNEMERPVRVNVSSIASSGKITISELHFNCSADAAAALEKMLSSRPGACEGHRDLSSLEELLGDAGEVAEASAGAQARSVESFLRVSQPSLPDDPPVLEPSPVQYDQEQPEEDDVKPQSSPAGLGPEHSESVRSDEAARGAAALSAAEVARRAGATAVAARFSPGRRLEDDVLLEAEMAPIGTGLTGQVRKGVRKVSETPCAVKTMGKQGLNEIEQGQLQDEVEVSLLLDHPHIVRLEEVFETDDELHLVMELLDGGDLCDALERRGKYPEEAAAQAIRQMLLAVRYLHDRKAVHRDLKLDHFMYENPGSNHLKLIDFGFAQFYDPSGEQLSFQCGSFQYVAPEVLAGAYTEKADLWSMGVIVYMLLCGESPWKGSDANVMKMIKAGKPCFSPFLFNSLSQGAQKLVRSLLTADPERRPSADEALRDPWLLARCGALPAIDDDFAKCLRRFAEATVLERLFILLAARSLPSGACMLQEDRHRLRQTFGAIDRDNNGLVSVDEVKSAICCDGAVSEADAEQMFGFVDINGNGEIGYSDFLAVASHGKAQLTEGALRTTFKNVNVCQSGFITVEDIATILGGEQATFQGHTPTEIIKEGDEDGDGMLSLQDCDVYFRRHALLTRSTAVNVGSAA